MELASTGRLIAWLGVSLLAVGIFLSNTLIFLTAALLLLSLLFEGVSFHYAVDVAKKSINLESRPKTIETTVGRPFRVETVISNSSHSTFSHVRFSRNLPTQIEAHTRPTLTFQSHRKQQIETVLKTKIPGRFEINTSTMLLERRGHLFSQTLTFPDNITIIVRPSVSRLVDSIDAGILEDLAVDHLHRGTGTDLAGIRPSNTTDNFHSINWKATARTGRLMTRESYLQKDPTIILMVDVSSSKNTEIDGPSIWEAFLNEAGNLLAAIRPSSSMGLILYDGQEVVASIEAGRGVGTRERILHTLIEKAKPTSAQARLERGASRPYPDLARETNALKQDSAFPTRTKGYWNRLHTFVSLVLPFYEAAQSKYFERVRGQGAFKAFEIISSLPEPVLAIGISCGETNLDSLAEGAMNARHLNHRVILVFLATSEPRGRIDTSPDLEGRGVYVLRCRPEDLSRAINAEILRLNHTRTVPVEATR